jgi:hypothetical protein
VVVREVAVDLAVQVDHLAAQRAQDARRLAPGMPLPLSTTIFIGRASGSRR